mgnify:CR=1 FL=1
MQPIIIIPARLASQRLYAKALKSIGEKPLVQHVWERAIESGIGKVYVATDHTSIAEVVQDFGGEVVMTDPSTPSGTDRVAEALLNIDERPDVVINLQGDLPFINALQIQRVLDPIKQGYDVGTLITFMEKSKQENESCVKAVVSAQSDESTKRCHWFCRAALPYGHFHLGVYAYKPDVLQKFYETPQHPLELQEKLEQLRFLTSGFTLGASLVDSLALEVNTPGDLMHVRRVIEESGSTLTQ